MKTLNNGYVLGLIMTIVELLVSNFVTAYTTWLTVVSGFAIGYIYASRNKVSMPTKERLRAILIYFTALILTGINRMTTLESELSVPNLMTVMLVLLFIFGLVIYGSFGLGSYGSLKLQKRKRV